MDRFRGNLNDGRYNGTIPSILGQVGLDLKVMVASGDSVPEPLALVGDKLLRHVLQSTEDNLVFKLMVNL